jgi:hypothetical protein
MPSPGVVGIHSGFLAVTADKKSSLGCQLLNRSAHAVANINLKSLLNPPSTPKHPATISTFNTEEAVIFDTIVFQQ